MNDDLWKKFFMKNPWEDFTPLEISDNFGWHSDHPAFQMLIDDKASLIIEVGTWKGASAITMLKIMKANGIENPRIICVDTWLGGVEHWDMPDDPTNKEKGWTYHMLNWKHGRPDIYSQFMSNIAKEGLTDCVVPISQTSDNAFKLLKKQEIEADVIYIDASHEYEDVYRDLVNYWQLLKKGGIMFGDDVGWDGVKNAVQAFSSEIGVNFDIIDGNYFVFEKGT